MRESFISAALAIGLCHLVLQASAMPMHAAPTNLRRQASTTVTAPQETVSPTNNPYILGLLDALRDAGASKFADLVATQRNVYYARFSAGDNNILLAPTDAAIDAAISSGELETSGSDPMALIAFFEQHSLVRRLETESFPIGQTAIRGTGTNANGAIVFFREGDGTLTIRGGQNSTVLSESTYRNVLIKTIDRALSVPGNLTDVWSRYGQANTILQATSQALPDLASALDMQQAITVFVPTDSAAAKTATTLQSLAQDPDALSRVLGGHIVNGSVIFSNRGLYNIDSGASVSNLANNTLQFSSNATGRYVTGQGVTARIVASDYLANNEAEDGSFAFGVIHFIDAVLVLPETVPTSALVATANNPYLEGLYTALQEAGAGQFASFLKATPNAVYARLLSGDDSTLLAPNDAALDAALASGFDPNNITEGAFVIEYHGASVPRPQSSFDVGQNIRGTNFNTAIVYQLSEDGTLSIGGGQNATVLANSTYENVLIQTIDQVLYVPELPRDEWRRVGSAEILLEAVSTAVPELGALIDNSDAITLFLPVDSALAPLGSQLESIVANTTLFTEILAAHAVNGSVIFSNRGLDNIESGARVTNLAGNELVFSANSSGYFVTGQNVTAAIVEADHIAIPGMGKASVLHFIDTLLFLA